MATLLILLLSGLITAHPCLCVLGRVVEAEGRVVEAEGRVVEAEERVVEAEVLSLTPVIEEDVRLLAGDG